MSKANIKLTAARLQRLFSGDYDPSQPVAGLPAPADGTADVLMLPQTDPGALDVLSLHAESLIVAPANVPLRPEDVGRARVATYTGDPTADDQEMLLSGGLVIGFQSYISATFVPLTCPTSVRMTDAADYESFLQDADAAVETGNFADFLLHPLAMLGDVCGLGTEHVCASRRRSRAVVGPDGAARPSLGGLPFADGDEAETACTVCLGQNVLPAELASARAARPWLSRYLLVLDVLRLAGGRFGGPLKVSGFGYRLGADLPTEPLEATMAPVLLRAGEDHLVCEPASRRVLRTGADAARVLEVALARDGEVLIDDVARHLDVSEATAASAVSELQATLDELGFPLRLGVPA
jgi:hypothetical protein